MAYKYINKTSAISGGASVSKSVPELPPYDDNKSWSNIDDVYLQYTVSGDAYGVSFGYGAAYITLSGSDAGSFTIDSTDRRVNVAWSGSQQSQPYDGRVCYAAPGASARLHAFTIGSQPGDRASASIGIYNVTIDQRHPNVYIEGGVWNGYGYQIV